MINNNMDETACFAGHLPLDLFSPLYHIAFVLIRCVRSVCVHVLYMTMCVFMRDFFFFSGEMDEESDVMRVPLCL